MFIAVNSISPECVNTFFDLLQTGNVAGSRAKAAGEAAPNPQSRICDTEEMNIRTINLSIKSKYDAVIPGAGTMI
jgi:hypothetical protein